MTLTLQIRRPTFCPEQTASISFDLSFDCLFGDAAEFPYVFRELFIQEPFTTCLFSQLAHEGNKRIFRVDGDPLIAVRRTLLTFLNLIGEGEAASHARPGRCPFAHRIRVCRYAAQHLGKGFLGHLPVFCLDYPNGFKNTTPQHLLLAYGKRTAAERARAGLFQLACLRPQA